ncbi:PfkB [hydrothermal vent metagenome]|uniref:PfkB n=1 Tax=hydrothermal vent metagenome TaxID=652676 RepID=A0A1W1CW46_9ZZZZ
MKNILVCGSYAYDHIMLFQDKFKNHILPDKVHMLNVSFLVPEMRKEFGGCAGNIVYNLNLLGANVLPMATVGQDFTPYQDWMNKCKINSTHMKIIENSWTGQAFITTDMDDNQITAFHPGAMGESHQNKISDAKDIALGIVSPDGRDGMIQHAKQFVENNIPFMFDPGQGMPMFSGDELKDFINQATWIAVNDYESQMLQDKTGLTEKQIAQQVEAYIITKGANGSVIYANDEIYTIPSIKVSQTLDPTGCGDAYRAGLLYGLVNNLDWQTTGQLAGLLGGIKIEHLGTQNHTFTMKDIQIKYQELYNSSPF